MKNLIPEKKLIINQFEKSSRLFIAISKEIMAQHIRNLHQLGQIYAFSAKHLVDVRLLTINRLSEPNDRATLIIQFVLDHLADVYIFHDKVHSMRFLKLMPQK